VSDFGAGLLLGWNVLSLKGFSFWFMILSLALGCNGPSQSDAYHM